MFQDNILPFNDCFYYNCFHSALFAVIQANHGCVLTCMASGIPRLERQTRAGNHRILYRFRFLKDYEQLLAENALHCEALPQGTKGFCLLREAVSSGAAAIVNVDGWGLSYRSDLYLRKHWPHTLLITGYSENTFRVIDQPTREILAFRFYDLPERQLYEAMTVFRNRQQSDPLYSGREDLLLAAIGRPQQIPRARVRELWAENLFREKEAILSGIAEAEASLEEFSDLLSRPEACPEQVVFLLDGLNDIVKQRRWMAYLARQIAQEGDERIQRDETLLARWELVRNAAGHIVLSGKSRERSHQRFYVGWTDALRLEAEALRGWIG